MKIFKNKKGFDYLTRGMVLIIIILSIYIVWWYFPQEKEKAIERGEVCDGFISTDWGNSYNCCVDCKELGFEYLKYEFSSSLFGASVSNCYCRDGNEPKQIW